MDPPAPIPGSAWEYRYLEGVGDDIEIEFVDDTLTGEYRLTTNADDKDALLRMPGGGMTDAEMLGQANRVDRIREENLAHALDQSASYWLWQSQGSTL